jgi:GNAT superfamily N-acetyltransferase
VVEVVGVRVAHPEDYERIVAVIDDWWGRPVSASLPRLFLDHFWSTSRVAEDEHGLGGFIVSLVSPSQPRLGYIHFVGVRPDHRRSGLTRLLYEQFAEHARRQGCTELRAITAATNTAATNTGSIRFHRDLGFTVSEPVADYNGPGRQMVTFQRQLNLSHDDR